MVLDNFMVASPKAKVLNATVLLFNFLAWVATCVGFGGALFSVSFDMSGGTGSGKVFWNHYHDNDSGDNIAFTSDNCVADYCGSCASSGKAFIAFQVFAFLGLIAAIFFTGVRLVGCHIGFLEPTRKLLFFELAACGWNTLWFFLAVCAFGGGCLTKINKQDGYKATGTGFAFTVICFLFLVANLVLLYLIRGDSSCHLGASAGTEYTSEDGATTTYQPPASYQYNASDPAAYAAAYNAEVLPASQQQAHIAGDNNL